MCVDMLKVNATFKVVLLASAFMILGFPEPAGASRVYEEDDDARRPFFTFLRPAESDPESQLAYSDELRENNRPRGAMRQYRALVRHWPNSREAPRAQYKYARLLEERGRESRAFDEYQTLIDDYAGQFPYSDVLERQLRIAKGHLEERRGRIFFFRGFTSPERAIPKLENIIDNAPQWGRAPEAQYLLGKAYEMTRDYLLAAHAYETLQIRYPRSEFVEEAAFGRARVLYQIAREHRNYDQASETAIIALNMFLRNHPGSEHRDTAREYVETLTEQRARIAFNKADYYDRIAKRPRAAIMAYEMLVERFPRSDWTEHAQSRIDALQSKMEGSSEK